MINHAWVLLRVHVDNLVAELSASPVHADNLVVNYTYANTPTVSFVVFDDDVRLTSSESTRSLFAFSLANGVRADTRLIVNLGRRVLGACLGI